MTTVETTARTHPPATRWWMLTVISLGFVTLTLNWFDIAPAFGAIGAELGVGIGPLAFLVSLFLIGYGVAHVPGGMLSTAIGMKRTLVIGLALQGVAGVLSGLATSYGLLALFRVLSGVGGSIFIAVAFAAVMVWFREGRMTLALGVSTGAAFSLGAVIALFGWVYVISAVGWHGALVVAGALELLVAAVTALAFRTPVGIATLAGARFEAGAVRSSLLNRDLWVYGIAILGGYGAYFTLSQLYAEYAVTDRGFPAGQAGLLSALVALAGVPGSIAGGAIADRTRSTRLLVVLPLLGCAAFLALIPTTPPSLLWVNGIGVGFLLIFAFSAWSAVPARVSGVPHAYVGTASGLMLTLAAVGGFAAPAVFGAVAASAGFDPGWLVLAAITLVTAVVGFAGRNPARTLDLTVATAPSAVPAPAPVMGAPVLEATE